MPKWHRWQEWTQAFAVCCLLSNTLQFSAPIQKKAVFETTNATAYYATFRQ